MNEEFELITVIISLAATAMNENNYRTATGKPAFSAVMQSMSRQVILPGAFVVRSLSAKYRPDRYRRDKSVKFGTELP